MQHTSLTPDGQLNSLIGLYETFLYVNIYGSYKLKNTPVFWPTLYIYRVGQKPDCFRSL